MKKSLSTENTQLKNTRKVEVEQRQGTDGQEGIKKEMSELRDGFYFIYKRGGRQGENP